MQMTDAWSFFASLRKGPYLMSLGSAFSRVPSPHVLTLPLHFEH